MMHIESLRFEKLTYQHELNAVPLLEVDFDFPVGQVIRIRSEVGKGKSTLLRILAGLDLPSQGRYLINDVDVTDFTFEEFSPYRKKISYSFEYGGLIMNRTIHSNLMLPFLFHQEIPHDEAESRVQEYCDLFGLNDFKELRPASVSGGLRKACCVARALMLEPELLLLDNPTAGLNPKAIKSLVSVLRRNQECRGLRHIVFVSDNEEFMTSFDHKTVEIKDRKLALVEHSSQSEAA